MSLKKLVAYILGLVAIFPRHNYGYEDSSSPTEFLANIFIDSSYGDSFFSELLAAKFIMNSGPYSNLLDDVFPDLDRSKRSIKDRYPPAPRISQEPGKYYNQSVVGSNWRPVEAKDKNWPRPAPVYQPKKLLGQDVKVGNHSYKLQYDKKNPPPKFVKKPLVGPLGTQITKPQNSTIRRNDYKKPQVRRPTSKNPFYSNVIKLPYHQTEFEYLPDNITVYEKKKLPKLIPPFPFGFFTKDPVRPFPRGSIFTIMPAWIVPFVPFGIWELRIPIAWDMNYIVESLNGYNDDDFTYGRSFANQQLNFYGWIENLLSTTLGMNGKACIQRLICELAEAPVNERSLMGEILHRIVEPRRSDNSISNDYIEAEDRGRTFGHCFDRYGSCPLTIRRLLPDNYVKMMKKRR